MKNYGLYIFEQNANTEATVDEIESWKNEANFLVKMQQWETKAVAMRDKNKKPYYEKLRYQDKWFSAWSSMNDQIILKPFEEGDPSISAENYKKISGDSVGAEKLSGKGYKSNYYDYKKMATKLENMLYEDNRTELAYFAIALRNNLEFNDWSFSETVESLSRKYNELFGKNLFTDLKEQMEKMGEMDQIGFDILFSQVELGKITGGMLTLGGLLGKSKDEMDLNNTANVATNIKRLIRELRSNPSTSDENLPKLLRILFSTTMTQMAAIDKELTEIHDLDLISADVGGDLKEFSKPALGGKIAKARRLPKYEGKSGISPKLEMSYSIKVSNARDNQIKFSKDDAANHSGGSGTSMSDL